MLRVHAQACHEIIDVARALPGHLSLGGEPGLLVHLGRREERIDGCGEEAVCTAGMRADDRVVRGPTQALHEDLSDGAPALEERVALVVAKGDMQERPFTRREEVGSREATGIEDAKRGKAHDAA